MRQELGLVGAAIPTQTLLCSGHRRTEACYLSCDTPERALLITETREVPAVDSVAPTASSEPGPASATVSSFFFSSATANRGPSSVQVVGKVPFTCYCGQGSAPSRV